MATALEHYKQNAANNEDDDNGLESFDIRQLGQKHGAFGGARVLKFNSGDYKTTAGETITPDRKFYVFDLVKVVQKFVNKKLVDSFPVSGHEVLPDIIKKLNAEAPPQEWSVNPYNQKSEGPWTYTLALKLLDEEFNKFCFITKSAGGGIAIGDLVDKIRLIKRIKGRNTTVMVVCEQGVRFKSNYNPAGVLRPSFRVVAHVRLAGDVENALPPPAEMKTIEAVEHSTEVRPAMTAGEKLDTFAGTTPDTKPAERKYDIHELPKTPKPPLKEDMNDELPI